jgi:hypothetical protein
MLHYVRPRAQSEMQRLAADEQRFRRNFLPAIKRLRKTLGTINEIGTGCPSDLKDYFTWIGRAGNCPAISSFFILGDSNAAFAQ